MVPLTKRHPVTGHVGPVTLGHELAGEVVEVGADVRDLEKGALVACGAGVSCGHCPRCLTGDTNLCRTYATVGYHWDGGLAEYCVVPAEICLDVRPYGLTPDAAALAQPMAIALHAVKRSRVQPHEDALVIGAGGIGAFLTYAVARSGRDVTVMDLNDQRLELARALGAANVIEPRATSADGGEFGSGEYEVIFEVSGTPAGLGTAIANARTGTRIVAVGVQKGPAQIDLRHLTLAQQELIGTVAHVCSEDLPGALELIAARTEGWADVAGQVIGLDQLVEDGLEPMTRGETRYAKTLVDPWIDAPRPSLTTRARAGHPA
jgi:(R,R)-butanediol dehydrogenase/meso-butanediol dehydrogenase/diacetyl reductase